MPRRAFERLNRTLEEAALDLGADEWTTLWQVTLPLLRPSITAGGLLVALYCLHDFGAVSLMRFQAFTQAIYLQYRGAFDRTPAAVLSLMLVVMALAVVVAEQRARGRARYYRSGAGTTRPPAPVPLGAWKWPALGLCAGVTLIALVLPVSVIAYWLARGVQAGEGVRLTWAAAGGSVMVSAAGAALAVCAALPIALLGARHPGASTRFVERISYSGYALPGIVVALAFVFFAANFTPWLYQTLLLVVVAYVVLFLPQAVEPLRGALLQVSPRFEEAGRANVGESLFDESRPEDERLAMLALEAVAALERKQPTNPIDAFIEQRLRTLRLEPAPPADRRTLIRRATFDLTGLPPAPEEVESFVEDSAPDREAFSRVIERLLASPHYGEQWARHWLDVVRYADSSGLANDYERPNSWRYRDYVVRAFNQDKPYDQFVREQIAGDMLPFEDEAERARLLRVAGAAAQFVAVMDSRSLPEQVAKFGQSALNVGLSKEEVIEAVVQTAPATGFPPALNALGVSVVPINSDLRSAELEYLLGHSDAPTACVDVAGGAGPVAPACGGHHPRGGGGARGAGGGIRGGRLRGGAGA